MPERGGACQALQIGEIAVTDVFHVRDGSAIADADAFSLYLDAEDRDQDVSAVDRQRGNPMARPEIAVSRIDARGAAWLPGLDAFERADDPGLDPGLRPAVRAGSDAGPATVPECTIGDAWQRYFELESQAADWDEVGGDIGRQRAYFWLIVGDCTLKLRRPVR